MGSGVLNTPKVRRTSLVCDKGQDTLTVSDTGNLESP